MPITEASISQGVWQVSETGASHLSSSESPGKKGNIIIYAHNLTRLFGPIVNVKKGDLIMVRTKKALYTYVVEKTYTVSPDQIELLLPTKSEVLTLYTCTGFLDSKRFVIQARPIH